MFTELFITAAIITKKKSTQLLSLTVRVLCYIVLWNCFQARQSITCDFDTCQRNSVELNSIIQNMFFIKTTKSKLGLKSNTYFQNLCSSVIAYMQTRCISGNYCNSYLKEGLFPEDVNGNLARGCLCERLCGERFLSLFTSTT